MTHVSVVVVGGGADDDVRVVDSSTPLSNSGGGGGNGIMTNGGAELSDLSRSLSTTSSQVCKIHPRVVRSHLLWCSCILPSKLRPIY